MPELPNAPTNAVLEPDDRWLTAKEAAAYARVSVSTLAKLRLTGRNGPVFCKATRRVTYRKSALNAWLTQRLRTSTSDSGR